MDILTPLAVAGQFFVKIAAELILLFIGITFLVGLLQAYIPEERIRRLLAGRRQGAGNIVAAGLGALTPFCSCSTVPILLGLLEVGIPFGACMSFLFASPLLNPVILALLLTVVIGVVMFVALGKNPLRGLEMFFWLPISSGYAVGELLVKATPLLIIALGLAVCFRSNVWNIGAEGQLYAGGFFTNTGGQDIAALARFDGTNWTRLGSGLRRWGIGAAPQVRALAWQDNALWVGGLFPAAGNKAAASILNQTAASHVQAAAIDFGRGSGT